MFSTLRSLRIAFAILAVKLFFYCKERKEAAWDARETHKFDESTLRLKPILKPILLHLLQKSKP